MCQNKLYQLSQDKMFHVFILDEYDMSKDGITHFNIEDWLLNKVNVTLS